MTRDFNIGSPMCLTVEEDFYGSKRLYTHASYGDYHPIEFDHRHLRLLVAVMDMALAANPLVNPLEMLNVNDEHQSLASVLRREHTVIHHTAKQLEDLHQEHKDTLARLRKEEEKSEQRFKEAQWERAWQREREQWARERAQWQAAQQEADHEGP